MLYLSKTMTSLAGYLVGEMTRSIGKKVRKCLGALYFLMKGTPFIYQGQEIGMTNVQFPSIEDYNDVGMINYYHG